MNIDVRTSEEFAESSRYNCDNVPLDQLLTGELGILADVPRDTSITVWCRSGARASIAVGILKSAGFINVINGH